MVQTVRRGTRILTASNFRGAQPSVLRESRGGRRRSIRDHRIQPGNPEPSFLKQKMRHDLGVCRNSESFFRYLRPSPSQLIDVWQSSEI